jgi:hypothetical protein
MLAALKAGGEMRSERAEVHRQVEETEALLRRLQGQINAPGAATQQPVPQSAK